MLHLSYHLKFTSVLQVFEDCKITHIFLQYSANTGIWSEPNGFPYLYLSRVRGFLFHPHPALQYIPVNDTIEILTAIYIQ